MQFPSGRDFSFNTIDKMNLKTELTRRENFKEIFLRLRLKAAASSRIQRSSPVRKKLSLRWLLANEDKVISSLIRELKRETYYSEQCIVNNVMLDKPRDLYSLSWADRIVEGVLALVFQRAFEPFLSNSLYSFRKGRSNITALQAFKAYIESIPQKGKPIYVLKQDIHKFGENIHPEQLLSLLSSFFGPQDEYSWGLVRSMISPRLPGGQLLEKGIPTGFRITPVCENFFLSDIDHLADSFSSTFYCRYGDDFLIAGPDGTRLLELNDTLAEELKKRALRWKAEKAKGLLLTDCTIKTKCDLPDFRPKKSFDHLGFNINHKGELFLSEKKEKQFKQFIRRHLQIASATARRMKWRPYDQIDNLARSLEILLKTEVNAPNLMPLLRHCTNRPRLKNLDRWLAKQLLYPVYGTSHDRVFRNVSFSTLRRRGIPSLVTLQNKLFRSH